MKVLNVKLDDWTHRNLKALAVLKETTIAAILKLLVGKEIEENPDCELCRKFGHEPNEETVKALKESRKLDPSKAISGKDALKRLDKEFGGR